MLLFAVVVFGQAGTGELRIAVTDSSGLPVRATVELVSEANDYKRSFAADASGKVIAKRLPFGIYKINVSREELAPETRLVDVRSPIPQEVKFALAPAQVRTTVEVKDSATLLDPESIASADKIGGATLADRLTGRPGRSLADLVATQPGWVFEANGVLHPRGEEYQAQYVIDGLPMTENRSAAFVPDFNAAEVQEMSVLTAGFPAEYGRKLGGVIEVETRRDTRPGLHGKAELAGGSFDTASGYLEAQYGWGRNTLTLSGDGSATDRYLDPPVTQNYANRGTTGDLMAHYERDIDDRNRIGIVLRREEAKFEVPNEIVQQQAGQRQDRDNYEAALQFRYQHIFSANVLGDFSAMARDITAGFWSNDLATPMIAAQDRGYREEYAKGAISIHAGKNELKFGGEFDYAAIQEALSYLITDAAQFDAGTPPSFDFRASAPDREQSGFAQDEAHWKNVTLSGGMRFDHYDLLVNETAWSPRAGIAYYWPRAKMVFRAAYDRIFQTPAFENLLLSSSPEVSSLSDQVLRLPVRPARGNYYQAGFARDFFGKVKLSSNLYRRRYSNFPDDDLLLNTGVSFPIAFARADIYGAEVKLEIPRWGPFSGYASYSNMRGNGYFPVTGGLFLGDQAATAVSAAGTVFPVSQDQRNTVRARLRYQAAKRVWTAMGMTYDSGLPIDFEGTYSDAVGQYGPDILSRVNFSDNRTRPLFSLNASVGVTLSGSEKYPVRLQVDAINLTNRLNVIDFAGLFSGTAIGAPRSVTARLVFGF